MAKRLTRAQEKAKKEKKLAIGLSIALVGVLVVQGPKLMKQLKGHGAPPPPPAAAPADPSAAAAAATASGTSTTPVASGQLTALTRLKLKDPFRALVSAQVAKPEPDGDDTTDGDGDTATEGTADDTASDASAGTKTTAVPPATVAPATAPPAATATQPTTTVRFASTTAATPSAAPTPPPPPNAAVVRTNGTKQTLFVGDGFLAKNPMFKLVALDKKDVRVGVLTGSFTNGGPTIKVAKGHKVVLADDADGERYVIQLVKLTNATPPPVTET